MCECRGSTAGDVRVDCASRCVQWTDGLTRTLNEVAQFLCCLAPISICGYIQVQHPQKGPFFSWMMLFRSIWGIQ